MDTHLAVQARSRMGSPGNSKPRRDSRAAAVGARPCLRGVFLLRGGFRMEARHKRRHRGEGRAREGQRHRRHLALAAQRQRAARKILRQLEQVFQVRQRGGLSPGPDRFRDQRLVPAVTVSVPSEFRSAALAEQRHVALPGASGIRIPARIAPPEYGPCGVPVSGISVESRLDAVAGPSHSSTA